jgi:drug/metabolite transporter (DMT)-like permease
MKHNQRLIAHLLLLAVVIVWGTTFSLVKAALACVSPLLFNLLRMLLAFAVLAMLNARHLRGLTRLELRLGATAGLFLGLGYQFQTAGLARTTPSKSAFITGLVVVIVPLLSLLPRIAVPGSPRPTLATFAGAILAFVGLVLLTTQRGASLLGLGLGEWLSLVCAVAFAAHLLTLSRAAGHISARRLGTLQIGFAALTMLVTLPLDGHPHLAPAPILWIALAVTALLGTAAAFTIQSWAQQHMRASHTALMVTLEPVFASLTALLFFHERLTPRALLGAALILAGILLAELTALSGGKIDKEKEGEQEEKAGEQEEKAGEQEEKEGEQEAIVKGTASAVP